MTFYNLARSANGRPDDSESSYPRSNRGWAAKLYSDRNQKLHQKGSVSDSHLASKTLRSVPSKQVFL